MNDYIKREDAFSVLIQLKLPSDDAYAIVKNIPSANVVEQKEAKWEDHKVYCSCSACGYKTILIPTNYCPSCGLRMRGYGGLC